MTTPSGIITSVFWAPPFEGTLQVQFMLSAPPDFSQSTDYQEQSLYYDAYHKFVQVIEETSKDVGLKFRLNEGAPQKKLVEC